MDEFVNQTSVEWELGFLMCQRMTPQYTGSPFIKNQAKSALPVDTSLQHGPNHSAEEGEKLAHSVYTSASVEFELASRGLDELDLCRYKFVEYHLIMRCHHKVTYHHMPELSLL